MAVTKPILLATAGATVDGRVIDDKALKEMASSYDPKTYAARINIEHIRGATGQAPFQAFGDVLSLSTGDVEVNMNGKTEKRTGLYGVLDIFDNGKNLIKAGQKIFPSVEIHPDFAGKGFSYLMGLAMTDSPASVATEPLKFNRALPGTLRVAGDETELQFAAETVESADKEMAGFFSKLSATLSALTFGKTEPEPKPEPKVEPGDHAAAFAAIQQTFGKIGETLTEFAKSQADRDAAAATANETRFAKLEEALGKIADPNQFNRSPSDGNRNFVQTDC